MYKVQIFLQ